MGHPPPPPWQPPQEPPPQWPQPWHRPPQYRPPQPPRNPVDVTVSIIALVITVLAAGAGAVMSFLSLAFLDYCPPATCSVDGAVTVAFATIAVAAGVVLTGLILTVTRLGTRKTAWPFAIGALTALIAVFILGATAYTTVVS